MGTKTGKTSRFYPNHKSDSQECKKTVDEMFSEEYKGSGIQPPITSSRIDMSHAKCAACGSKNVLVIYAKWSVNPNSGDSYSDYEVHCQDCGTYTVHSYSEN